MAEEKERCHILILDQVTDPQNIGAIIRSCAAFGTLGLVVQDKNSPLESGAMVKATAGTMEFVPVARVTNLSRAIEQLKDNGFWVMGMDGYADVTIDIGGMAETTHTAMRPSHSGGSEKNEQPFSEKGRFVSEKRERRFREKGCSIFRIMAFVCSSLI